MTFDSLVTGNKTVKRGERKASGSPQIDGAKDFGVSRREESYARATRENASDDEDARQ